MLSFKIPKVNPLKFNPKPIPFWCLSTPLIFLRIFKKISDYFLLKIQDVLPSSQSKYVA